jgi:hypothetical protein
VDDSLAEKEYVVADTWVNDKLKMNCIAFDSENKEHVLITNGRCTLDHSSPDAFRESHKREDGSCGCHYEPSEAIAIRVIGTNTLDKAKLTLAWTYRGVNAKHLSPADNYNRNDFAKLMTGHIDPCGSHRANTNKIGQGLIDFIGRV